MVTETIQQDVNVAELQGRPIGRIMVKMGKLTREQVHEALGIQKEKGGPIGQIMIDLGYIVPTTLVLALAFQVGMEYVDLEKFDVPDDVIKMVSAQMANAYKLIPLEYDDADKRLTVALGSADNFRATDDMRTLMGLDVVARIADPEMLERALHKYYDVEPESIGELINEIAGDGQLAALENRGESIDLETIREAADSNPIRRLVNMVLLQAIRDRASDIHFEPFENEFKIRYRIDGLLYEMVPPPKSIALAIASRIKVMADLDIAERRLPQDGRIELVINGQPVDLRISVLPTMFGESVVMRVLDRSQVSLDLEQVGFREDDLRIFRQLINRPNGICVVTGPTGSGKTTTLYSGLNELNDVAVKILTTEDPVEYDIDGLIQVQINDAIGLTFGRCLRSFLRQDPDIILVGEIRDLETGEIAIQASLTGHMVFSTLHTNDAPSAIARLLDLGLEPYLITATLEGIVGQRLVRRICPRCREEFTPTEEMLMELQLRPENVAGRTFFRGSGCDYCRGTGYSGRTGIFEIMLLDDTIRELIIGRASTNALREAARRRGMRTLRESGLLLIYDGVTTIEEVVSQTIYEEME
ncbi:MAG: Flp pilus assembly complex ATPase component TadA [Phycisphaerae bacterium]|nr:Flp pilus assembly complex ATPase component TadA [Phycisphaerae bacterium]